MVGNYKRELLDYIQKNMAKGYSIDSLKWALVSQGYPRSVIDRAIQDASNSPVKEEKNLLKEEETKPQIKHEIIDEYNKPIIIKKPWWKRIFG